MSANESAFDVKPVLDQLRFQCGDSEFGYRLQALFAHVLLRLGGSVSEINAQGHPDVKARLGDRELWVQVKTSIHSSASTEFQLSTEDLAGITAEGRREGCLAFLDCAEPVEWIMVGYERAERLVGRSVQVATLRAESDAALSEDCTLEFREMVLAVGNRLLNLTYRNLCHRALKGESL